MKEIFEIREIVRRVLTNETIFVLEHDRIKLLDVQEPTAFGIATIITAMVSSGYKFYVTEA